VDGVAKRKKKKKALLGSVLKYEIYGIMLITISVIALSGEAAVGRSLSSLAGYLLGRFYFVLPLIGIFFGLMVMIHRRWPNSWNSRHTGMLLLVMSMALMSTISAMEQKLGPLNMLHPGNVLNQIHNDLKGSLTPGADGSSVYLLGKDISGGYIGALEYAALLWLFGSLGAKLLMIVMLAISFMLVTNLSYIELFMLLRVRAIKLAEELRQRAANRPQAVAVAAKPARAKASPPRKVPQVVEDDDEEDEQYLPKRKQPLFFQKISQWTAGASRPKEGEILPEEEEVLLYNPSDGPIISGMATGANISPLDEVEEDFDEAELDTPIIRDFFEHIRSEGLNDEDREDWSEFSPAARGGVKPGGLDIDVPPIAEATEANQPEGVIGDAIEGGLEGEGALEGGEVAVPAPPLPPPPKPYKLPSFRCYPSRATGVRVEIRTIICRLPVSWKQRWRALESGLKCSRLSGTCGYTI
jgi:S-DNA-T family DNA segregation ATPase FtsK/SpoIIIE